MKETLRLVENETISYPTIYYTFHRQSSHQSINYNLLNIDYKRNFPGFITFFRNKFMNFLLDILIIFFISICNLNSQ